MNPVIFPLRRRMKRAEVSDLHEALRLLGFALDAREVREGRFGSSTAEAVRSLQGQFGVEATGDVDEATAAGINDLLRRQGALDARSATVRGPVPLRPDAPAVPARPGEVAEPAEPPERYVVEGMVRDARGAGVAGLTVHAYELRLRSERLLGSGTTARNGFYRITYDPPQEGRRVRERFQMVVKVEDAAGGLLHVSEPVHASPSEWIDFLAGGGAYPGRSELETRLEAVRPALDGAAVAGLVESEEHQDISFVARESGLSPEAVMELVVAHRLEEATQVPAAVFYAFLRQGQPPNRPDSLLAATARFTRMDAVLQSLLSGIASLAPDVQEQILESAVEANAIPLRFRAEGERRDAVRHLQSLRVSDVLERPHLTGKTPLRALLGLSALPPERYGRFAELYAAAGGAGRDLWARLGELGEEFPRETVADLRRTLELGAFVKNHPPLIETLKQRFAAPREMARLDLEEWKDLIRQSGRDGVRGYPDGLAGETEEEKIALFAQEIQERVERAFPTTALAARIARLDGGAVAARPSVLHFFENNPDLDLRRVQLDRYLHEKGEAALAGIEEEARPLVVQEVKKAQRALHLAPVPAVAATLLANGYHTASRVYAEGRTRFTERLAAAGVARTEARRVFYRAEQRYAMLLARLAQYNRTFNRATPAVIHDGTPGPNVQPLIASLPSMRTLFGAVDFCACEDCDSVYSPAAYLVDMLRWLDKRPSTQAGVSAKDILFRRRPDLGRILLNCANTNTPLPYVDLVCELLEDAVAPPPGPQAAGRQTTLTAAELRAHPEHLNAAAYEALRDAVYPIRLPYHLWLEEARAYLGHLGVTRWQLMETFQDRRSAQRRPADVEIAAEYLGLSAQDRALITTADPNGQADYWGTPNPAAQLSQVARFLARTGLSYEGLQELLAAGFVQGSGTPSEIDRPTDDCDTTAQTITNLSPQRLDRMHRFLRLHRRTSWRMWELDRLLRCPAVGGGNLDGNALVRLWQFHRLQTRLKLSVEELLAFYEPLNTETRQLPSGREEALYQRLFLNRAVFPQPVPAFELGQVTAPQPSASLAGHLSGVLAALTVTAADLDPLLALTDGTVSLASLSVLYRYVTLARALRLSVAELLAFLDRIGEADPFAGLERTAAVLDLHEDLVKSGFKIEQIEYLLDYRPDSPAGLRVEVVAGHLRRLREERQKVRDELATTSEPKPAVIARRLAAFPHLARPEAVASALAIITGSWAGTAAARDQFIAEHFAVFADVAEAQARLGALVAASDAEREARVQERCDYVLGRLERYAAANRIKDLVATAFGLEHEHAGLLLTALRLQGSPSTLLQHLEDEALLARDVGTGEYAQEVTPAAFPSLFEVFHLLHKASLLVRTLRLSPAETEWLLKHPADYNGLDLALLPARAGQQPVPFQQWRTTLHLLQFKRGYPEPEGVTFFGLVAGVAGGASAEATRGALSTLTGWPETELEALGTGLGLQFPGDYRVPETYRRLAACFALLRTLGVGANRALRWATVEPDAADAADIKQAVKSRYAADQWLAISEQIQETVREQKRAALVEYLVARPDPANGKDWQSADDLFAHFLIDVEMSPCLLTSRIVQANGAVQLFVQRCLMNLEPDVVADPKADEDWLHWKWMRQYRVWEANRKVFLYPENWIWPEQRADKSPFFKNLEDELAQGELTDANAEQAFLHYLEKLDEVARLQVCGMYHEQEGGRDVLHVVARTKAAPPVYYYRRRSHGRWSAWEKVDVDIKADQVLPVVYNRRLHLFWPVFMERPQPQQKQDIPLTQPNVNPSPEPMKYWEIQLGWSVLRGGTWTPARISQRKLVHPWPRPAISYTLKARPSGGNVVIDVFLSTSKEFNDRVVVDSKSGVGRYLSLARHNEAARPWHSSQFVFNGDVTEVRLKEIDGSLTDVQESYGAEGRAIRPLTAPQPGLVLPNGAWYQGGLLVNRSSNVNPDSAGAEGKLYVLQSSGGLRLDEGLLLKKARLPFSLVVPHQDLQFDSTRPFFYQDGERAYFVTPTVEYEQGSSAGPEPSGGYGGVRYRVRYRFQPSYHPYTDLFVRELHRGGVDALFSRDVQVRPETLPPPNTFRFSTAYAPEPLTEAASDRDVVDFSFGGTYSLYNWELFFHAPLLIALRLAQNQRFEEAMRWFHYIFNPTNADAEPGRQRSWICKPFYEATTDEIIQQRIDNLLREVNRRVPAFEEQVRAWRDNPFDPHLIAGMRPVAYQKAVVMKYLDCLIAWADHLFRSDSREALNEATQLYLMAAAVLGPRPQEVPKLRRGGDKTYDDLEPDLDEFGNALAEVENTLPPSTNGAAPSPPGAPPLPAVETFYFGIPPNERMLQYWDTVESRLFRLRHCMDIEGRVRDLPLFAPPIDPGLLVKAAAAGVDLGSVLSDVNAPLPRYRFHVMVQKAQELCGEVRSLGAALLSALEKRDAEALALLRSSHEVRVLEAVQAVRTQQAREAAEQVEALEASKRTVEARRDYYASRQYMNLWEIAATALSDVSVRAHGGAILGDVLAGVMFLLPDFQLGASGFGGTPHITAKSGGQSAGKSVERGANGLYQVAALLEKMASMAAVQGSYQRRWEEWEFQRQQAEQELEQIERQMAAARIRQAVAEMEVRNHELMVQNARAVDEYLHEKFTNRDLYDWMVSQLATVYFQSYQLAYEMARRAERCFQYELGLRDASYVKFGYWDSLKKGLLAGEKLAYDLRRMEAAYLDQNERHFELTKHVSLAAVDPLALLRLRETGECFLELPETLFDLDYPGHYLRRIKSVSLTIPCVAGPYTGVHCTLTLEQNSVRVSNLVGNAYARDTGGIDSRFVDQLAAVQSIATSSAQNDSGLFELSFRDERYLPFEGAGAISRWRLELPRDCNAIDLRSIPDVILHLRYTARDGGPLLRQAARQATIQSVPRTGVRMFSLRHEFPDAWHRFLHPASAGADQELVLDLTPDRFPFFARSRPVTVTRIELLAAAGEAADLVAVLDPPLQPTDTFTLTRDALYGDLHHAVKPAGQGAALSSPLGQWRLKLRRSAAADFRSLPPDLLDDVFLVVRFEVT